MGRIACEGQYILHSDKTLLPNECSMLIRGWFYAPLQLPSFSLYIWWSKWCFTDTFWWWKRNNNMQNRLGYQLPTLLSPSSSWWNNCILWGICHLFNTKDKHRNESKNSETDCCCAIKYIHKYTILNSVFDGIFHWRIHKMQMEIKRNLLFFFIKHNSETVFLCCYQQAYHVSNERGNSPNLRNCRRDCTRSDTRHHYWMDCSKHPAQTRKRACPSPPFRQGLICAPRKCSARRSYIQILCATAAARRRSVSCRAQRRETRCAYADRPSTGW